MLLLFVALPMCPLADPAVPDQEAPYARLTPDCILDAAESVGIHADGRLLALNSFENRVYLLMREDAAPLVFKFYRPGRWSDAAIIEEHQFSAELAEREIPVVPPLVLQGKTLHQADAYRFAVFARQAGRAPEVEAPDTREWLGRFLGRIHAVGRLRHYRERETLGIETFGHAPAVWVAEQNSVPPELQAAWDGTLQTALEGVAHCFARAGAVTHLRLHGDCHLGNLLWAEDGPHFVDFDDSRSGPAIQDLWMLLSGERSERQAQLGDFLAGYEDFCEFDRRELQLIEALRTLRLIHHAGWLARRWHDPAFPAAFPWFASPRYWEARILELKEQIAAMEETPLIA